MLSLTQDVKKTSENSILTTIAPLKEAVLPNDIDIYLEETESIECSKYDMLVRFNNHLEFNDFYTSLNISELIKKKLKNLYWFLKSIVLQ